MMGYVKAGTIKTIIVKDFSRFARDYIEASDYLENIFPFIGVHFIAINDFYDSASQAQGSLQDMEVVIKNIVNAAYSRDMSAKIAATKRSHQKKAMYLGGYRHQKAKLEKEQEEVQNDRMELSHKKAICYEKYADDEISKEEFLEQKSAFETEIAAYDVRLGEIKATLKKVVLRNNTRHTEMRQLQNKVSKFAVSDISIELAEEFLEKIYTYNVERLEIKWKYEDDIKKLIMGGELQ